jgi:hypothetical protein
VTSGLIGAEQVAHVEPDVDTLFAFNDAIVTIVPISRPGCALGHSDFEPAFWWRLSNGGSTRKMKLNFHPLASALGIFLTRASKKGATQAASRPDQARFSAVRHG